MLNPERAERAYRPERAERAVRAARSERSYCLVRPSGLVTTNGPNGPKVLCAAHTPTP